MTQTSTLPAQTMWTTPHRDKYGRPRTDLMATVIKDGDTTPRWQTCVVLTTLPKTVPAHERYMVTNWMAAPFIDGVRQARVRWFPKRNEAKAYAEELVTEQAAKTEAIQNMQVADEAARLWA